MDGHAAYLARRHFPSLDGLRCLAILPVIWHHSTPRPLPGVLGKGPLGVHLFFAISGFLVTTLLLRERRERGRVAVGAFYGRRALRLLPLYYAVLGLYVLRAWLFLPGSPMRTHFLGNVPWFATFTANFMVDHGVPHPVIFGYSWSLSTEVQFYLLFPWVLAASASRAVAGAVVALLLSLDAVAERGVLSPWLGAGAALDAVTSISAPVGLGCLMGLGLDSPRMHGPLARVLGGRGAAPAVLAGLAVLIAADAPLPVIHLAMAALAGAVAVHGDHGLGGILEARPVRHVGTVSYGVYLFHVPVITAVKALLGAAHAGALAVFALALPVSVAAATVSFRHLERRVAAWRRGFLRAGTLV